MTERGFKYDELTEADDATVERSRPSLHAAPCGQGVWVSVLDGTVYEGHGGNEREQWGLQERGPWVRLANADFLAGARRDAAREALDGLARAEADRYLSLCQREDYRGAARCEHAREAAEEYRDTTYPEKENGS